MTFGVSPERVREVRFAEQWRGYRTDEVDQFVEQVAEAFDQLEARVRESSDRAAEAERRLLEGGHDQDLSRTLILAQRTADAARQEATADAARLVGEAEEQARLLVAEAEVRRARLDEEVAACLESELGDLTERKATLEREASSLSSFVEHERRRLADELRRQLAWLEQAGSLEPLSPLYGAGPFGAGAGASTASLGGFGDVVDTVPGASPEADPLPDRWVLPHDAGGEPEPDATARFETLLESDEADALVDHGVPDDSAPDAVPGLEHTSPDGDPGSKSAGVDAPDEDTGSEDTADDDAALDDAALDVAALDVAALDDLGLSWRAPEHADQDGGQSNGGAGSPRSDAGSDEEQQQLPAAVDDPFMAELRRAQNDPEPLGPRDDAPDTSSWGDTEDMYGGAKTSPRFRRRRQR